MKNILMIVTFAFVFSGFPAMAQEAAPTRHGGLMEKMDLDGDGAVTREEFLKVNEERFAMMDSDGDGKITKEELAAHKKKMKEMRAAGKAAAGNEPASEVVK